MEKSQGDDGVESPNDELLEEEMMGFGGVVMVVEVCAHSCVGVVVDDGEEIKGSLGRWRRKRRR